MEEDKMILCSGCEKELGLYLYQTKGEACEDCGKIFCTSCLVYLDPSYRSDHQYVCLSVKCVPCFTTDKIEEINKLKKIIYNLETKLEEAQSCHISQKKEEKSTMTPSTN